MSEYLIFNPDSAPFWQACKEGRLTVQRCRDCRTAFFFPRWLCPQCSSIHVEWITCSGLATVYSYSVVRRQSAPALRAPYVLALVDLDEGPRLMTHIVECSPDDVHIGMRVKVNFNEPVSGVPAPRFEPV
jgi:uncharacterized OB-fold protein